eukprot:922783_1
MLENNIEIATVEMHTGGEPLRIVTSGYPPIKGKTILEKRKYLRNNLDHIRKFLMFEPRGHSDMYGAILVEPDLAEADIAVCFMHNEGYSTMCGHAVIGLGRYAVDRKLVKAVEPETKVVIQCPCGLVTAYVSVRDGKSGAVRFTSVPSFAFELNVAVGTERFGEIRVDVGYGGAFYAIVDAKHLGLDVRNSPYKDIVSAATEVTEAVRSAIPIENVISSDLDFLYGTIVTDGLDQFCSEPTANLCVFADAEVDRSPCGSGVSARVAVQWAKRQISKKKNKNCVRKFVNARTGSVFEGRVASVDKEIGYDRVVVEVSGKAFYTG